ncbi:hypothetical protein NMY22_g9107 [Coprinellus aureogranulatus]|nr:hypothetical protein NMY22_g9107 [Coprinellus aureogranulatus]
MHAPFNKRASSIANGIYSPAKVLNKPSSSSTTRRARRLHPIYHSPSPFTSPSPAGLLQHAPASSDSLSSDGDLFTTHTARHRRFVRDLVSCDIGEGRNLSLDGELEVRAVAEASSQAVLQAMMEVVDGSMADAEDDDEEAMGAQSDVGGIPGASVNGQGWDWELEGGPLVQQEQETPETNEPRIDEDFLKACRFYNYDPQRPTPTNLDIIFRLGNYFGAGVTKAELRQILRRCKTCRHFLYADLRSSHRCTSEPLVAEAPLFDIVGAFLSHEENSGFTPQDLRQLLAICPLCGRIVQADRRHYHDCVNEERGLH